MKRLIQLAATSLLATLPAATGFAAKPAKPHEDVEWIWQYTPDANDPNGRENELIRDPHFQPFLDQFLTTPQSFWGVAINGRYRSLANTALDHLSVPDKVLADDNRYVAISGCVIHFCPSRGLLWVDLNGAHHLVVFAAIDWTKQGAPTSDPAAQYTVWVFPNDALSVGVPGADAKAEHVPAALTKALGRWAAEPLPGTGIVQNITHAVLVDPDGTPHEVTPAALGIEPPAAGTTNDQAPVLKPRN